MRCLARLLACLVLVPLAAGCAIMPSALSSRLASVERPEQDVARDTQRRPDRVLDFLGVESGMTAVDLVASSGYYTEVLSIAVGPRGRVYAQNDAFTRAARDGYYVKSLDSRLASGRIPNVEKLDRELSDLGLDAESVDFALTALNFHDIHHAYGEMAVEEFLAEIHRVLKPDGVFGVIDHAGRVGANNAKLHRIPETTVRRALKAAGFVVEARSALLRNRNDDRTSSVFYEGIQGRTDRFILRVRKAS